MPTIEQKVINTKNQHCLASNHPSIPIMGRKNWRGMCSCGRRYTAHSQKDVEYEHRAHFEMELALALGGEIQIEHLCSDPQSHDEKPSRRCLCEHAEPFVRARSHWVPLRDTKDPAKEIREEFKKALS